MPAVPPRRLRRFSAALLLATSLPLALSACIPKKILLPPNSQSFPAKHRPRLKHPQETRPLLLRRHPRQTQPTKVKRPPRSNRKKAKTAHAQNCPTTRARSMPLAPHLGACPLTMAAISTTGSPISTTPTTPAPRSAGSFSAAQWAMWRAQQAPVPRLLMG